MSEPYSCTDSVEDCRECPRYMDDCDGTEETYEKTAVENHLDEIMPSLSISQIQHLKQMLEYPREIIKDEIKRFGVVIKNG